MQCHVGANFFVLVCPDLPGVEGTTSSKVQVPGATENVPGTQINFACPRSHNLVGSPTLTCQNNRAWDNLQPFCANKGNKSSQSCKKCVHN